MPLRLEIYDLTKFKPDEEERIREAIRLAGPALNSELMHRKLTAMPAMTENKGFSLEGLYQLFFSGAEPDPAGGKPADGVIKISMEGFFDQSSTIGYTYLGGLKTWVNRRFLRQFTAAEIVGHIVHETMHRFGFTHGAWTRAGKLKTVPYQYGYRARNGFEAYYSLEKWVRSFAPGFSNAADRTASEVLAPRLVGDKAITITLASTKPLG